MGADYPCVGDLFAAVGGDGDEADGEECVSACDALTGTIRCGANALAEAAYFIGD